MEPMKLNGVDKKAALPPVQSWGQWYRDPPPPPHGAPSSITDYQYS